MLGRKGRRGTGIPAYSPAKFSQSGEAMKFPFHSELMMGARNMVMMLTIANMESLKIQSQSKRKTGHPRSFLHGHFGSPQMIVAHRYLHPLPQLDLCPENKMPEQLVREITLLPGITVRRGKKTGLVLVQGIIIADIPFIEMMKGGHQA